jgi:hypothetical protein
MKTSIGYIDRRDLTPEETDICADCRSKGLNICEIDEICQARLAAALGNMRDIDSSIDFARKKGLIKVREIDVGGEKRRFIKITEEGEVLFALMK